MTRQRVLSIGGATMLALILFAGPLGTSAQTTETSGYVARGLYMPPMDPRKGRELFLSKGCVVCHRINGVGGQLAPQLDASVMQGHINPFDVVAKMWSGAEGMLTLQKELLDEKLRFSGQELADLIGFLHDENEQSKLSRDDLSPDLRRLVDQWSM